MPKVWLVDKQDQNYPELVELQNLGLHPKTLSQTPKENITPRLVMLKLENSSAVFSALF